MSDRPWNRLWQFLSCALLALSLLAPMPAAADGQQPSPAQPALLTPQPILTNLGSLDGSLSGVYAINDRGQMVGYSSSAHGQRAVLWQDGKIMELPTMNTPIDGRLALLDDNAALLQGSVQFSDLSVWSYARLDPAELAAHELYLLRLAK